MATLLVWSVYLHLILRSYRHHNRSKILINYGAGRSEAAKCIIANMSAQPIYVDSVIVTLRTGDQSHTAVLSDQDIALSNDSDFRSQWFQGPLDTGEYLDLGGFDRLIGLVADDVRSRNPATDILEKAARLDVLVAGLFTGSDRLIAAERRFDLVCNGAGRRLRPRAMAARQIRGRRELRNIERFMLDRSAAPYGGGE